MTKETTHILTAMLYLYYINNIDTQYIYVYILE